ncbi:MAG: hypothetical protein LBP25_03125 [Tannerellaceae bacterium]|jgi:hypothetical protein|nr:hypothetical protein [Tannerellaceae bacterium]
MKLFHLLAACLPGCLPLGAQDVVWKTGVHSFFDNTEFGGSAVQIPQTMAGVHLAPEAGLSLDGTHRVFAGADLLHEYGSERAVDFFNPVVYYEYAGTPFRFYAGAIPRRLALDRYPRMFFQDSILNYRPVIHGVFWEYRHRHSYANVWLDWTGRQTRTRHEAFFMGWSGRYGFAGGMIYAQHFGYMFHFAGMMNPVIDESIHDNGLMLTSLGLDLSEKTGFAKLEANLGWAIALDRDRGIGVWNKPQGILAETKIEYRGLGLFNSWYKGGSQQVYYSDHGNLLYWGDPVYRATEYNRLDLYIRFIQTAAVTLKFAYSLHFMEKNMYHEQAFYATFNLDNITRTTHEKKYRYLWDQWF